MFFIPQSPTQRLVTLMQKDFGIKIELIDKLADRLNQLSSKESGRFIGLLKTLRQSNISIVGKKYPDAALVHSMLDSLNKYSLNDIQQVSNTLYHHKLSDPGHIRHFVELMDSFEQTVRVRILYKNFQLLFEFIPCTYTKSFANRFF